MEPWGDACTSFLVRSSGGHVGTHLFDALNFLMELKMMETEILRRLNDGRDRGRIRKIRFFMAE